MNRVLLLSVAVIFLVCMAACQDQVLIQEKSPFSANIVRLGDSVAANIEGTNIYVSDIQHEALSKGLLKPGEALTPSMPLYQRTLDELIDQRLLALEALRRSLDQNDETRRRIAAARERILASTVVETVVASAVTEETIARMFEEQASLQEKSEQVRARLLVAPSEEKAREYRELALEGGSFAVLAKEFSMDPSTKDLGGDLGYFAFGAMSETISKPAFAGKNGDISAPFKYSDGWAIVQTLDRRFAPRPTLTDIRRDIERFLANDALDKLVKRLRISGEISVSSPKFEDGAKVLDAVKPGTEPSGERK